MGNTTENTFEFSLNVFTEGVPFRENSIVSNKVGHFEISLFSCEMAKNFTMLF